MWEKLFKLQKCWRRLFDGAISIINPKELDEENGLDQSFLLDFCSQIKSAYLAHAPSHVRLVSIQNDAENNWLIIQFGISHARKLDEIGVRWSGDEVTVDFLPGGSTTSTVCFKDNYGLRWVILDCSKVCFSRAKSEKADIERIISNAYAIAQHYKPYLKFIIGRSAVVKAQEKKL